MTFLNKIIIGILSAIFVVSLIANFMLYKGLQINIDKRTTNHQEQYQQQWQGQLLVNQWTAQGNEIEWRVIHSTDIKGTTLMQALNRLHPISAMYAKVLVYGMDFSIVYPDIFIKTTEIKK